MVLTLISATPSPFARMNRIAMAEKGIEFKIINEVPWNKNTQTPEYNPLEKLPILIFDDGRAPIYDSAYIQEYIVQKWADKSPSLLTGDLDMDMKCRQLQTLAEGILDAFVLVFWESQREVQSEGWLARQNRKIDGGMNAFNEFAKTRGDSEYLIGNVLTIADIAAVCSIGQVDFGNMRPGWKEKYPEFAKYYDNLNERDTFKSTKPEMFELEDNIV